MRLEALDAGHWGTIVLVICDMFFVMSAIVHAEKPHEFKKLVADFIRDSDHV
jgi:hypothetical protein